MCLAPSTSPAAPGALDDRRRRNAPVDRQAFPYLRVRGNVALIGVTTARATAPFMANGFFREDQAHRLGDMLDATRASAACSGW